MFTGIVAGRGEVLSVDRSARDWRLIVRHPVLSDVEAGASVAIDGVCLTVAEHDGQTASFDVSPETRDRSTLAEKDTGDAVNLERPLRAGDELGGHIVQGHVDGVAEVVGVADEGEGVRVTVSLPAQLCPYVVEKGSVALDGVSLTITDVSEDRMDVALVPHTLEVTTLGTWKEGRRVNVEVDILSKHIERLLGTRYSER